MFQSGGMHHGIRRHGHSRFLACPIRPLQSDWKETHFFSKIAARGLRMTGESSPPRWCLRCVSLTSTADRISLQWSGIAEEGSQRGSRVHKSGITVPSTFLLKISLPGQMKANKCCLAARSSSHWLTGKKVSMM